METEALESSQFFDPNKMPFPGSGNTVTFRFQVGDPVAVHAIGYKGIITAIAVNNTHRKVVLIDNGMMSRWYSEDICAFDSPHVPPIPPPPIPQHDKPGRMSDQRKDKALRPGVDDHGADDD